MRPDRIIVGEVRGAEICELLTAYNSGHAGSMSTLSLIHIFILPASCGYDLYGIAREEWRRLLDLLDDGQYDVILLDLSDGVQAVSYTHLKSTKNANIMKSGHMSWHFCITGSDLPRSV